MAEFFGFGAGDLSPAARRHATERVCPFLQSTCIKRLARTGEVAGVCAVRAKTPGSPAVICCPIRLYGDDHRMLRLVAADAFGRDLPLRPAMSAKGKANVVAVFGKGWGGELRLPQRQGMGAYFVDWVLARLDDNARLAEFTAIEVQTIDTTGNYNAARQALLTNGAEVDCPVGLNWENVNKRILPQLMTRHRAFS